MAMGGSGKGDSGRDKNCYRRRRKRSRDERDSEKWDDDSLDDILNFSQCGEFPCPKKQRADPQEENGEEEEEEEEEGGGEEKVEEERSSDVIGNDRSISVTLTDENLLDCPICFENLTIPVYQCHNGHLVCWSCSIKLPKKCPSCSSRIGYSRCRGIEQILESLKVSCENIKYGCKETVFYSQKHDHKDKCIYTPCSCPLPDCEFTGSSKNLFLHFTNNHSSSAISFCYNLPITISIDKQQKYVIFQEQEEDTLFVLNNTIKMLGNVININCIARSSSKIGFPYALGVGNGGSYVNLKSFTEFVPFLSEHTLLKMFLVVPNELADSCGKLNLKLCIMTGREPPDVY